MKKQQLMNRWLSTGVAVVALLVTLPVLSEPPVSWQPPSIELLVMSGTSLEMAPSFTADEDLSNVMVLVASELAPFLTPETTELGDVAKGETRHVILQLAIPLDTETQTLDGTVQLRQVGKKPKNYAKSLQVHISVEQGPVVQTPSGLAVSYPARLRAVPSETTDDNRISFFDGPARSHPPVMISETALRLPDLREELGFAVPGTSLEEVRVPPLLFYSGKYLEEDPNTSRFWACGPGSGHGPGCPAS